MRLPNQALRDFGDQALATSNRGGRLAFRVRQLTQGMRGFRMKLLGVMFFGLLVQRLFTGFLRPIGEAFGVFELFRIMLQVLFLPIMEKLFPVLLKVFEVMVDLPEPVKLVTILGAIFGTLLFVVGSVGLGIGALIATFPGLAGGIPALLSSVVGFFSTIATVALAVGAALAVVAIGIFIAWKENFANIRGFIAVIWEGIKNIFSGAFNVIVGLTQVFTSIVRGDFEGLKNAILRIWEGVKTFFIGAVQTVLGVLTTLGIGVFRVFKGVLDIIIEIGNKIASSKIGKFVSGVAGGIGSLFGGGRSGGAFGDFIIRPGQAPIAFSPNDTVVGFRGGGVGGGSVQVSQTNNIQVVDKAELERIMDDSQKRLVDEVRRLTST